MPETRRTSWTSSRCGLNKKKAGDFLGLNIIFGNIFYCTLLQKGHPIRTLYLSAVTILCKNWLFYVWSGKIVGKKLIYNEGNGVINITVVNPFVVESGRGSNGKIVSLISVPFCVNTVQCKRHDS